MRKQTPGFSLVERQGAELAHQAEAWCSMSSCAVALRDWLLPLLMNGQAAVGGKCGKTSQVFETCEVLSAAERLT